MNPAARNQFAARLFEAAAAGDQTAVSALVPSVSSVDVRDDRGWTALMMAARRGHANVVGLLLQHGCDANILNSSGQTAKDIAKFWNFPEILKLLDKSPTPNLLPGSSILINGGSHDDKNFFANGFLDRAAHKRKDTKWIKEVTQKETTVFVLFKDLEVLVTPDADFSATEPKGKFCLYKAKYSEIKKYVDNGNLMIFLGLETGKKETGKQSDVDQDGTRAWFALDVPGIAEEEVSGLYPQAQWMQSFPGSLQLASRDSGVFAQARSVLAWHDRYGYCPTCGHVTTPEEGGYKRQCTDDTCRSRKGVHNTCYPRVDPTVIMAVVCPEGSRLLLGRGARFPRGMYSCLAGFVEPGETLESACRREVLEEAGVAVGRVQYHSCQPWPMPASLMVGCIAHATSDSIQVDKEELEDARWFSRQDVINMLNNRHSERFFIPPEQAIAHVLIRTWVNMTSNL